MIAIPSKHITVTSSNIHEGDEDHIEWVASSQETLALNDSERLEREINIP